MARAFLINVPTLPELIIDNSKSSMSANARQTSIFGKQFQNQSNIGRDVNELDNDSTSINSSSSAYSDNDEGEDDDNDNTSISSRKNLRMNSRHDQIKTNLMLESDAAEFFAFSPFVDPPVVINNNNTNSNTMNKLMKKPHKIRMALKKKFQRSNSSTSEDDVYRSSQILGRVLFTKGKDEPEITVDHYQVGQEKTDDSLSNISEHRVTSLPHLSFEKRTLAKIDNIKMEHLLESPNGHNHDKKKFSYPYTDIVKPHDFDLLHVKKIVPTETLLIQHKPFRHKKIQYRTQRGLTKIGKEVHELKQSITGKSSKLSAIESSPLDGENYQSRLIKNLLGARREIAAYDRTNSLTNDCQDDNDEINNKLKEIDVNLIAQIEEHQTKSISCVHDKKKRRKQLISAPFIERQARHLVNIREKENINLYVDSRFNPAKFIDLDEEAKRFFGTNIPFTDQSPNPKSSLLSPCLSQQSSDEELPPAIEVSAGLIVTDEIKPKDIQVLVSIESENYDNDLCYQTNQEGDDEFFDCVSTLSEQTELQLLPFSNNEQAIISLDECESVEF
ncbi:unnamed protein product [Rotaria socialis]|uniref:Uncharacterized protein n=1 Tax=Rotaria socialis TaxID=392032 RepID=A0A817P5V2_9BILA|nr:unnamed protein product [Rotaria socialis]CAF3308376.1 unnamed protein product [Rotaria socialis]CAF3703064.1 unnamed protein product [Rotaria socialis]CAF4136731.1 unnamed protein product [Rotaria socialis]CAF4252143.1 unnamed protein product [Rotaria socialis]